MIRRTFKIFKMFRKRKWLKPLIPLVKFALHFLLVQVLLFCGAVALAFLEDPVHTEFTSSLVNRSKSEAGKYLTANAFADGNSSVFLLFLRQHFNISIAKQEERKFVSTVVSYHEAVQKMEQSKKYEQEIHDRKFIFMKWYYFVTIATTTIGYGDIFPQKMKGRVFYIFFSIAGIPLMMTLLASCGDIMTAVNKKLFGFVNRHFCQKKKLVSEELLSALIIFLLLFGYVAIGCLFVTSTLKWDFVDALYYWVVTFTTVGFGDVLLPLETQLKYLFPLTVYRLFGLALLAGCIDSLVAWMKVRRKALKEMQSFRKKSLGATSIFRLKYLGNKTEEIESESVFENLEK